MRVLISAYSCEPGKGSEPGIGWNWVRQTARVHQVWVLTRERKRDLIERALQREPIPNAHFVYVDLPRWASFYKFDQRGVRLHYCLWQAAAWRVARRLDREIGFDLTHHLTWGAYWLPSFLPLLGAPFLWGPLGGGESAPRALESQLGLAGRAFEALRNVARAAGECSPLARLAARRASLALAATFETAQKLEALGCRKVQVMPQVGLPAEEILRLAELPARVDSPFRLISVGRLLHWKGFDLGLRAFAAFARGGGAGEYWIVGDGPERGRLERLAAEIGVRDRIVFWGAIERPRVWEKLAQCDVLIHPSLHDSGGWVCLEAMGASRPVVCLNTGGPALLVSEESGIRIPAVSRDQVLEDLTAAIRRLAEDPALVRRMGEAARRRVREQFVWEGRSSEMLGAYQEAARVT